MDTHGLLAFKTLRGREDAAAATCYYAVYAAEDFGC